MNISMDNFFKDIDGFVINNPTVLAKEYLKYILDNPICLEHDKSNSFFVTKDNNNLGEITKKCFLVSDGLSISCKADKSMRFTVDYSDSNYPKGIGFFAFGNNLEKLGIWLQDVKKLLISNQLSYYPNIYSYPYGFDSNMQIKNANIISNVTNVVDAMEVSKRVTGISKYYARDILLSSELVMSVEIPIVNGVRLNDFCDVVIENVSAVEAFQKFMRTQLHSLDIGSKVQLQELGTELQNYAHNVQVSYQRTISKYLKSFGYTIAFSAMKAMLYIIKPEFFEIIKNISIFNISWEWEQLLVEGLKIEKRRNDYKNEECYFLWLLSEKK